MLEKIEALLRKAESSDFEEEAALFYAKAQELMERYAISEEELWQIDPSKTEAPILESMEIKGDAAYDKFLMLSTLAKTNRCKAWKDTGRDYGGRTYYVRIAGYPSDITFVLAMYSSLLLQLDLTCVLAEVGADYIESLRTWRVSFTAAFCSRVSIRLVQQHERRQTSTGSKELVLAREQKVESYIENDLNISFSPLRFNRNSIDRMAYDEGRKAGDSADIGTAQLRSTRKELR